MASRNSRNKGSTSSNVEVLDVDTEWLELFDTTDKQADGWLTASELVATSGRNIEWLRKNVISPGVTSGTIEVSKMPRRNIVGDRAMKPVYRLVKKED